MPQTLARTVPLALALALTLPPAVAQSADATAPTALSLLRKHAAGGGHRTLALEQLARAGHADARATLQQLASTPGTPVERQAVASLARLGDGEAAARLGRLMGEQPDLETVRALEQSHTDEGGAALVLALRADAREVRAEAASAIGRLRYAKGADALRKLADDPWVDVRAAAGAALVRLGDQSMVEVTKGRLETPMPEAQLAAADAWAPETAGPWTAEVEPLLRNPTAETRHAAGRRLWKVRREPVVSMLRSDLAPGMPEDTRIEAMRLASLVAEPADVPWIAKAMSDAVPEVQILAAGTILRLTSGR
jgi:HEAT repeat protein